MDPPSILLKRAPGGWAWRVIGAGGEAVARGGAVDQGEAMDEAWQAVRRLPGLGPGRAYPEIIVEISGQRPSANLAPAADVEARGHHWKTSISCAAGMSTVGVAPIR